MKCPKCGHWNKPSFPRCFQCGEPLNAKDKASPAWQQQFEKIQPEKKHVLYDDASPVTEDLISASEEATKKSQESLAFEMNRLRERRIRGTQYLEEFRRNAAEQGIAPSGSGVSIRRSGGFFEQVPDDPEETVYPPPEIRSRLRSRPKEPVPSEEDDSFLPLHDVHLAQMSFTDTDLPPSYDDPLPMPPPIQKGRRKRNRRGVIGVAIWAVRILAVVSAAFVIWQGVLLVQGAMGPPTATEAGTDIVIEEIEIGGLPGRRILIPGEEGTQYYISELTKSYVVIDGTATIEVPDYVFYENIEHLEASQMEAVLTPTLVKGSTETRLSPIFYTVDIPLSPVRLISPEVNYLAVSTSIYNLRLSVSPGSKVTVNGRDISDAVDINGTVSDNPPIKAIGENLVTVTVRAPYCRENNLTLVFYREPQEIPLELAPDTTTSSRNQSFEIKATTMAGATITMESPYYTLDDSLLATTGEFTVKTEMVRVGYNTVRIRSSYPGKRDSVLEHVIYYLPSVDVYSRKAWALTSRDYMELMTNITSRIEKAQPYECQGVITEIIADNPQLAIMDTSTTGSPQLVMLQNESSREWVLGESYRVYADVSGVYNDIPRLTGRFTYDPRPATNP